MGSTVGLRVACLRFLGFGVPFQMGLRSPYFSLVVHCRVGVFSYGLHVCGGFLVHCIQASTLACSFLPIALDSSLVTTVLGRVRGFLAGG